ncbi:hypothetical protein, unlikely [Trypanosoma congolense IL3000]|uniref:Uncharacterized protein n=1 Tax=Trypanosoma congolense (strain IL3000) TaxID=1068625 RepID=F9WBE7_TRYCI|nr:hypothetical protein, unlikely [Trypanosoma congolense IL3000]
MNHVVERMMSVEETRKQSQAFLFLVSSLQKGVEEGHNMTQLLQHTKKAVKETVKEGGKSDGLARILGPEYGEPLPWYFLFPFLPVVFACLLLTLMLYGCLQWSLARQYKRQLKELQQKHQDKDDMNPPDTL